MERQASPKFVLGLDVGASSVGWALLETPDNKPSRIIKTGARVFEAGVEGQLEQGKEESRNKKRRDARGHRRVLDRRADRKGDLWSLLQESGLVPEGKPADMLPALDKSLAESWVKRLNLDSEEKEQERLRFMHTVPYFLRARALDEKLSPHELGRALYHLSQRQGFKSNRKATPKDEKAEKEEKGMKAEMSELRRKIEESGARTLGEYFSRLDPEEERIRSRHTSRPMYEDEFEAIWNAQSPHYPDILTEEFKKKAHNAIFYQRPLKSVKKFIGDCELEENRKRAPWALLDAQRFRLLQKVNDLEFIDTSTGEKRKLNADERTMLIEALETQGDLKFPKIRKLLKLPKAKFNFEGGGNDKLVGNHTAARLTKIFGEERWKGFTQEERDQIVEDVHSIEDEKVLARRGKNAWGLDDDMAKKFGDLNLEDGYCRLSRQAIARLLPLMEKGKSYMTAVTEVYGERPAQEAVDSLPPIVEAFPNLRNPAVIRVLTELRKVVNNIIRKHGKPEVIRVELARDLKKNRKEREGIWKKNRQNEKAREEAVEKILREMPGFPIKGLAIEKVLLAEECDWHCPYTGKSISMNALLGPHPQFDIEHTIPFGRCLDNSFYNKTLCCVNENRNVKGNRTPFEAYGSNPEKWDEILQRVKNFKGTAKDVKLERFELQGKALEDLLFDFENRKLTDTAYASRLAMEYLGLLYGAQNGLVDGRRIVQAGRGQVTSYLRGVWKLNKILSDGGEKSRDDHRHHAVDAVCIALTDAGTVKMLSDAATCAKTKGQRRFGKEVAPPWPGFFEEASKSIEETVVSHRVGRKVSGPLHEETNYSRPIEGKDDKGKPCEYRHVRKQLGALTRNEVEEIVDPAVKQLVLEKLGDQDPKKFFANKENHPHLTAADGRKIPIHKVRIRKKISTFTVGEGARERHVATESNHHIEVVAILDREGNTKKSEGYLVSLKEARDRLRAGEPVVKHEHGEGKRFVFSLAGGEIIEIDEPDGTRRLYVIRTITKIAGRERIAFVRINDARKKKDVINAGDWKTSLIEPLRKLNCKKVIVTPLGEVRRAND
ncbi:MAG: type II CRISPR RNA-guided endonuclease Cas9 [Candidatus Brocadiales bacterium]|nr:type II CRISPR RNA-guided endonuclease Cas9 [Candidatus Brocadiales bacterium]